jgi:hypothetical protein
MYKNVLRSIVDIEIFPVIGLAIFMGFFVMLLIYVFRMSRAHVHHMETMPCEPESPMVEPFQQAKL